MNEPKAVRVLVAEDDSVSRRLLEATLVKWGFHVVTAVDGRAALELLCKEDAPKLAIIDWMMPEIDGIEVCRRLRQHPQGATTHVIILTAKGTKEDVVQGLESGADDYLIKPFDRGELRARVRVGLRILEMQQNLADRVRELEDALSKVKQLQRLVPICSYCKKIRDDSNYWQQVEQYMTAHTEARFTHGICPDCMSSVVKAELQKHGVAMEEAKDEGASKNKDEG
jgi:DNA-binding response OmpR family regulator